MGDNIFEDNFNIETESFVAQGRGARVFIKKVDDPQRFGVPEISGDSILQIEEKPQYPKSPYAVTGFYFYDNRVWNLIKTLKPSGRGELEITDVNNFYIQFAL